MSADALPAQVWYLTAETQRRRAIPSTRGFSASLRLCGEYTASADICVHLRLNRAIAATATPVDSRLRGNAERRKRPEDALRNVRRAAPSPPPMRRAPGPLGGAHRGGRRAGCRPAADRSGRAIACGGR